YTLPTPIYPTLKIGFSAATGGSTNNHEIRNLTIDVFDALADKQATGGFNGTLFAGSSVPYVVNVTNNGPDGETGPITVSSTLPASLSYAGFTPSGSWSCSNAGQLVTCSHPGPLASGASLAQLRFDVNVAPSAAGTFITNNATVSGTVFDHISSNNTVSSTRFVYGGSSTGLKNLYAYFSSAAAPNTNTLRRVVPGAPATTTLINGNNGSTMLTLTPALARPLVISSSDIAISLCLARQGATGGAAANRNARVELSVVDSSNVQVGPTTGQTRTNILAPITNNYRNVLFNVPPPMTTIPAGHRLRMQIINTSAAADRRINVASSNTSCTDGFSRLVLDASTVIDVASVGIFTAAYPGGSPVSSFVYDNGTTLWLRALITDPFGSFDITGADYRLFNNANTQVGSTVAMTQVADNAAVGERTFQTSFVTPAWTGSSYSLQVTGKEGTEGTVTHVNAANLQVRPLPPMLAVTKLASQSSAAPGTDITYTVQMSNTGTGNAIDVILRDDVSPFTVFRLNTYGAGQHVQFVDGAPASGLAPGTVQFSNDGGLTYTYTPSSGAGGAPAGYDGNVTHMRLPFTGSMPPGRNFSVNYVLRVR
ncbi:MAG: hypothetical protein ACK4UT_07830, partial [Moraxellaceae bacterium]